MKRSVFYSWQSDTDPALNRNPIEQALVRALSDVRKDPTVGIEPVLDRDTAGLPGAPAISDAIFAKIALADVFVADVTVINPRARTRRTPNPNVLIELGLAVSVLGWDRIVLVMNTAFGTPEALPFDLRGRRTVTYDLRPGQEGRSEARGLLQGRLESALRTALRDSTNVRLFFGANVGPVWWGQWHLDSHGPTHGGLLFVREVASNGFLFDLSVNNGAHSGHVAGTARIVSSDLAYARLQSGDGEVCELSFHRSMTDGRRTIVVQEDGKCWHYRGMGAYFGGPFVRARESLLEGGVLDELGLQRLYSITGQYYESLSARFQGLSEGENFDLFQAKVTIGGVRGLYTIMEGILMEGAAGELWVAFIDNDVVRYFTTKTRDREQLPATIEKWRERFKDKAVVLTSDIERVPEDDL